MGFQDGPTKGSVTVLRSDGREYHIVGTAHVSKKSIDEVWSVIREVKPNTVCVELDPMRYEALTDDTRWRKLDIFQILRENRAPFLLATLTLQAFQRQIGERLGVKPGRELLAGVEAAREVGAEVILADRDVGITLRRTWAKLGAKSRAKVLVQLVASVFVMDEITEEEIEALKQRQHVSDMMSAVAKEFPEVKAVLIDERDRYMMSTIEESPGKVVVAVVGNGHVEGMIQALGERVDRDALKVVPKPSPLRAARRWILPAMAVAVLVYAYRLDPDALLALARAWVIPTAAGCALFAVVAGAHPVTALIATILAPLTTLLPVVPVGKPLAFMDAVLRRPSPIDAERLGTEVSSFSAMRKNRFSRVLLVYLASNTGAFIGSLVALVWLLTFL